MRKPQLSDARLVAVFVAAVAVALLLRGSTQTLHGSRPVLVCFALIAAIALLLRLNQPPIVVLALIGIVAVAYPDRGAVALPLLIAMFVVAYRAERRVTAAAALATLGVLVVVLSARADLSVADYRPLAPWAVAVGLAVAAGLYFGARRDYVGSLHDRAAQLERERILLSDQAVADERVRIARELHDVVAHGVSLMVVQAQALGALDVAERDEAASRIAAVGRGALTEMHRMLDVLRPHEDEGPELAPAPGVRDVPALVEGARSTGLEVDLAVEGEPLALPASVDLSAYRIVQEALTNVIKHAHALHSEVRLHYTADALELTVSDDGGGALAEAADGHGLLGMRERVALFGGTLEAGEGANGHGYEVHAVLPL